MLRRFFKDMFGISQLEKDLEKFRKEEEKYKIYEYVLKVIRSCKTDEQLEVAVKWADRVMKNHNITFKMLEMINKARIAKRVQIKNGLAIIYSAY